MGAMNAPLLLACAVAAQAPAAWELKLPYQTKAPVVYGIAIELPDQDVAVSATVEVRVSATSDTGMQGLLSWRQIVANNEPVEDWEAPITLTLSGMLRSLESEFGPDATRMNTFFFPAYPDKPVAASGEWSVERKSESAADAPGYSAKYTAKGVEKLEDVEVLKVAVELKEAGAGGMQITGHYWFDRDGKVRKFDLDIRNWPVPHVGQSVGANIIGLLKQ